MRIFAWCLLWAGLYSSALAQTTPIKHVIIIMQENRSFDHYFGTFPGANGIPPGTCVPNDPSDSTKGCIVPFHDPHDVNAGGPHTEVGAETNLDDGITTNKMDGFVYGQTNARHSCQDPSVSPCRALLEGTARHDVMGYHDATEIPNYWTYAQNFVLQDMMFEPVRSWSYPSHVETTSEWVAVCTVPTDVNTCTTGTLVGHPNKGTVIPWANLFQLLDAHSVSWKYYLGQGDAPDCEDGEMDCPPTTQMTTVQSIWNPMPYYSSVKAGGKSYLTAHNPPLEQFYADITAGALPQVSWIVPANEYSEHPANAVTTGMEYVTGLINAVAASPYWQNTAIFLAWDDWGGFYDHVVPPVVDTNNSMFVVQGYGLRVPGLVISVYAKKGYIDHSVLSFDSYATFFEDVFMGGARLDPAALGTPDSRPDIRDSITSVKFPDGTTRPIGNLMDDFDFTQPARPPMILPSHIPTGIEVTCRSSSTDHQIDCTQKSVTVSWIPVTNAQVPGPFTYHVQRDGVELPKCVGTATSCVDKPGSGTHLYTAASVDATGSRSPNSAAAEADVP